MGAINYRTSDYITLAARHDYMDFTDDNTLAEIKDAIMEDGLHESLEDVTEEEIDDYIYWLIGSYYEDDYENAKYILGRYNFNWFTVKIESGYYEGFSIDIEYEEDGGCFCDYEEKQEAQKEVTQVKECLLELAGIGLKACYPFWCTRYEDYKGTLAAINEAVKEMRADVKNTHTNRTWYLEYCKQKNEGWIENDKYLLRDF